MTAFTLAHSITLSLAALSIVALPSRWVESGIALSVVLAALNNLFPVVANGRWIAAFGFGLLHGFGFAGALQDLGLPTGSLALSLAGFNLGVEAGQLAIVVVVPAAGVRAALDVDLPAARVRRRLGRDRRDRVGLARRACVRRRRLQCACCTLTTVVLEES